jgi:hypothetical protein
MPIGRLSVRARPGNRLHHLYRNNGDVWWVHYTLNWDGRTRRIRRSLGTKCVDEAVRRRDDLFARIEREGEPVPERRSTPTILPMLVPSAPAGAWFTPVTAP